MKIFIGSSTEAIPIMDNIAVLLEDIDFVVKRWNDNKSFILGKSISENLSNISNCVDAAIFLYAEDDQTWYKDRVIGTPRDNVLFEHGFFAGKLGLNKSIIIKYKDSKIPSDLKGIIYAEYKETKLNTLKDKLKQWKKEIEIDCKTAEKTVNFQSPQTKKINEKQTKEKDKLIALIPINPGTYKRIADGKEIKIHTYFSISKYLITQEIYKLVTGNSPSHFEGNLLPIENVSFFDAIRFCNQLSVQEGYQEVYTINNDKVQWNKDIKGYRLPFEAEWEYALGYSSRDIKDNLNELAWYSKNAQDKTHNVGLKKENSLGIYDLLGNVWEWCFDNYTDTPPDINQYFQNENSKLRVLRGGAYVDFETQFQKFRKKYDEDTKNKCVGFRIVLQNI